MGEEVDTCCFQRLGAACGKAPPTVATQPPAPLLAGREGPKNAHEWDAVSQHEQNHGPAVVMGRGHPDHTGHPLELSHPLQPEELQL